MGSTSIQSNDMSYSNSLADFFKLLSAKEFTNGNLNTTDFSIYPNLDVSSREINASDTFDIVLGPS